MADRVHTHVSNGGRIVIPAELRKKLGLEEGTEVTLTSDEHSIHITPCANALNQLQRIAETRVSKTRKGRIVDEFLAERRAEAKKE